MKVRYSKPKGLRIKKVIGRDRPFFITTDNLWFNLETGQWEECHDFSKGEWTSAYYADHRHKDLYSLKSVKRKIAKWNVPIGTVFKVSLYVGHNFLITK